MREEKWKELKGLIESLKTIEYRKKENIQNSFLSIEQYECQLNNGNTIVRDKLLKNGGSGNAAIILPITQEGNVILVVEPRVFTKETVGVELPAGYIEVGETETLAAARELEEETGYVAEKIELLTEYYQDQGCSEACNKCFLATGCKKKKAQQLDESEFIKYFECSYEEALELLELGYIKDAGSIIALEKSKQKIKRR